MFCPIKKKERKKKKRKACFRVFFSIHTSHQHKLYHAVSLLAVICQKNPGERSNRENRKTTDSGTHEKIEISIKKVLN